MDARGAITTELAWYRLTFLPSPVGSPGPSQAVCNRRRQDGNFVPVSTVAATDPYSDFAKHFAINASG